MATMNNGILGGFSGKLGTVIGGTWRGVSYMRSLPTVKKNRKATDAQSDQQVRFRLAMQLVRKMAPLQLQSFENTSNKLTKRNFALQQILAQAIGGLYPDFFIDLSKVQVAKGSLIKADNPTVNPLALGTLTFSWKDTTGLGNSSADDKAILVTFCPEIGEFMFNTNAANRSDSNGILDARFFSGKEVHTWIAFRSADGKRCADSTYLGIVMVP